MFVLKPISLRELSHSSYANDALMHLTAQILTTEVDPRTVRVKLFIMAVDP